MNTHKGKIESPATALRSYKHHLRKESYYHSNQQKQIVTITTNSHRHGKEEEHSYAMNRAERKKEATETERPL